MTVNFDNVPNSLIPLTSMNSEKEPNELLSLEHHDTETPLKTCLKHHPMRGLQYTCCMFLCSPNRCRFFLLTFANLAPVSTEAESAGGGSYVV